MLGQRVRRIEWDQTVREAGTEVRTEMVVEYVRFGVPLDLDVPDDFVDVTELELDGMQQGQSR